MSASTNRPSIKDVADRAGCSLGTVSNVLNSPEKVREETRKRVQTAMAELGFVRSYAASQLRSQKSAIVGIIVLDINNPFFMEAASAIEKLLRKAGCLMMLASSGGSETRESELLDLYVSMNVRGIILALGSNADPKSLRKLETKLRNLEAPVVLFDHPPILNDIPAVYVNDYEGERIAIQHLIDLGHQEIGFINGPKGIRQSADRLAGALAACHEAGFPKNKLKVFHAAAFKPIPGAETVHKAIQAHPEITAFACANDLLAIGAMRALGEIGLSIPADISVIGYDDITIAPQLAPPLTSIHQPMNAMGWQCAKLLLNPDDKEATTQLIPELVIRGSTAAPRG